MLPLFFAGVFMSDVFISYSRKESDFVHKLHDALTHTKRDVWVDWQDIPLTANWWSEICSGIESAHSLIFVISPHSIASPVCHMEIAHAIHNNKRLISVVRVKTDEKMAFNELQTRMLDEDVHSLLNDNNILSIAHDNWQQLSRHNWLLFEDDVNFDENFERLIHAIDTDLAHVKMHTRLLVQAIEWKQHHQGNSFLLFGDALQEADRWLTNSANKNPRPTELQLTFITISHQNTNRRQRMIFTGVTIALAVAIGLSFLSLTMFSQAVQSLTHSNMTERVLVTQLSDAKATNQALITEFKSINQTETP